MTEPIGKHNHIVIAFITSVVPRLLLETDIIINESNSNFRKTGLSVTSVIITHKLVTIPINLIKRELGKLDIDYQKKIESSIRKIFNL